MSPKAVIFTIPIRVVKIVESVEKWEWDDVEGGDVVLVKKSESAGQWECEAGEFLDALWSVKSGSDLIEFVKNYRDPGIHDREYLGIQEFAPFKVTKNYVIRPQSRIFLSAIREFQSILKQAVRASLKKWRFKQWFDPDDLNIGLELKNGKLSGVCRFHNGAAACLAVIYLEKLSGIKFGACALCGEAYRKTSRHKRKYCNGRCAHRASMRMFRARKKKIVR